MEFPFNVYQGASPYNCPTKKDGKDGLSDEDWDWGLNTNKKTRYRLSCSATIDGQMTKDFNFIYPGHTGTITVKDNSTLNNWPSFNIYFTLQEQVWNSTIETWSDWANTSTQFTCKVVKNCKGENSVLLVLNTPNGGIFHNGEGEEIIQARLYEGGDLLNPTSANWTAIWEVLDSKLNDWVTISDNDLYQISTVTSTEPNVDKYIELTIQPDAVDSLGSFRCVATYKPTSSNPKTLIQYQDILDYNDPLQVYMYSTAGLQFVNGDGLGAVYTRVFLNGVEKDELVTNTFVTTLPTSGSDKQQVYHIFYDATEEKYYAVLKEWNSSQHQWNKVTDQDPYDYDYSYDYRDRDGNILSEESENSIGLPQSGKVIPMSAKLINEKLTIDVEVTKKSSSTTNS